MTSLARISTPRYLDPANGQTCGTCAFAEIADVYDPSGLAICTKNHSVVNIRRKNTCTDYIRGNKLCQTK